MKYVDEPLPQRRRESIGLRGVELHGRVHMSAPELIAQPGSARAKFNALHHKPPPYTSHHIHMRRAAPVRPSGYPAAPNGVPPGHKGTQRGVSIWAPLTSWCTTGPTWIQSDQRGAKGARAAGSNGHRVEPNRHRVAASDRSMSSWEGGVESTFMKIGIALALKKRREKKPKNTSMRQRL